MLDKLDSVPKPVNWIRVVCVTGLPSSIIGILYIISEADQLIFEGMIYLLMHPTAIDVNFF